MYVILGGSIKNQYTSHHVLCAMVVMEAGEMLR